MVFGHIHGSAGKGKRNGVIFANVSYCDESYQPVNAPMVFDVEKNEKPLEGA